MKVDIFAISDVHGHASIAEKALADAGFEINNPRHLLVVNGDCFDRGPENRKFYQYLSGISNKVLIRGNHEDALDTILWTRKVEYINKRNGMECTVEEFFRNEYFPEFSVIIANEDSRGLKELTPFLSSMRDYFETENYVFTHGWVPSHVNTDTRTAILDPHWRHASPATWYGARWLEWQNMYRYKNSTLAAKTLVVGHRASLFACQFDGKRSAADFSIYRGDGVIAIDSGTYKSKLVNVLVLRDEEIPDPFTHEMKLLPQPFEAIKNGIKTVEMRLYDEKREAIRPGDKIIFTNTENGEKLKVTVAGLHSFNNFKTLSKAFTARELGFPDLGVLDDAPEKIAEIMNGIYTKEQIDEYGALAIRITLSDSRF